MRKLKCLIPFIILPVVGTAWAGDIRVTGQFISENAAGPPMQVNSLDKVLNLNADRLDGMNSSDFVGVSELATADSGIQVHWKNITNVPGVEIDQDCATGAGCFTGDTGGFPVTITEPGSYRLASNLTTGDENTTLISIQASNVTLDLHGFALLGPVNCTDTPVTSCSPPTGSGDGVHLPSDAARTGVTISNGAVQGMGDRGIDCEAPCKVVRVHVSQNADDGILAMPGAIVENVVAFRNGDTGILADGLVRNSLARGNGGQGTNVGGSIFNSRASLNGSSGFSVKGSVINSTAENNVAIGFALQDGSTAIGNAANDNGSHGFSASFDATFKGNTAFSNGVNGFSAGGVLIGNTAKENTMDGFHCSNCLLTDNVSKDNLDQGVNFVGSDSAWGRNMLSGNANPVSGSRVDLGNNACNGSLIC